MSSNSIYETVYPTTSTLESGLEYGSVYGPEYYNHTPTWFNPTIVQTTSSSMTSTQSMVPQTTTMVPSQKYASLNVESPVMYQQQQQTPPPYPTYKYIVDPIKDTFLAGHQINGRVVYPVSGYMYLIWQTMAKMEGYTQCDQLPIEFENVEFHNETTFTALNEPVIFTVTIMPKSGQFELYNETEVLCTGRVFVPEVTSTYWETMKSSFTTTSSTYRQTSDLMQQREEIYAQFRQRGYNYQAEFQPIVKANIEGTYGELLWSGKWIAFLEGMIQFNLLNQQQQQPRSATFMTRRIKSMKINPKIHWQFNQDMSTYQQKSYPFSASSYYTKATQFYPVFYNPLTKTTYCGGIEFTGIYFASFPSFGGLTYEPQQVATTNAAPIQFQEFLEFYLSECKRVSDYVARKMEFPTTTTVTQTPFPAYFMPAVLEQQIIHSQFTKPTTTIDLIEGGRFLQLLQQAAHFDLADGQYASRVHKLFNHKLAYWTALEEDALLAYLNNKNFYFRQMLEHVLAKQNNSSSQFNTAKMCAYLANKDFAQFGLSKLINEIMGSSAYLFQVKDFNFATEKLVSEVFKNEKLYQNSFTLVYPQQQQQAVITFSPFKTYIITNGLSEQGFELAKWLAEHGARYLLLTSRSGAEKTYPIVKLKYLQDLGVEVKLYSFDFKEEADCLLMLEKASFIGGEKRQIGGFFNFDYQYADYFPETYKIDEFMPLYAFDKFAETSSSSIDKSAYFVVFSSALPNTEVEAYNYFKIEKILENRRRNGMHALKVEINFNEMSPMYWLKSFQDMFVRSVAMTQYGPQQLHQQRMSSYPFIAATPYRKQMSQLEYMQNKFEQMPFFFGYPTEASATMVKRSSNLSSKQNMRYPAFGAQYPRDISEKWTKYF